MITRYLSDEFTSIYKSDSQPNLNQSYDETMVIEETVETVNIDSELQMVDVSTEQVSLEEIPLEQENEVASQDVETEQPTQEDAEVAYLNSPQTPTQDEPLVELEGKLMIFPAIHGNNCRLLSRLLRSHHNVVDKPLALYPGVLSLIPGSSDTII